MREAKIPFFCNFFVFFLQTELHIFAFFAEFGVNLFHEINSEFSRNKNQFLIVFCSLLQNLFLQKKYLIPRKIQKKILLNFREFLSRIFTHNCMILDIKSFLFVPRQISNILYRCNFYFFVCFRFKFKIFNHSLVTTFVIKNLEYLK